jgi:hypothetical protein
MHRNALIRHPSLVELCSCAGRSSPHAFANRRATGSWHAHAITIAVNASTRMHQHRGERIDVHAPPRTAMHA